MLHAYVSWIASQGATNPHPQQGLIELGSKMIAAPTDRPDPKRSATDARLHVFGQFIDHDLTLDLKCGYGVF
jgi:hypothetical protein